MGGRVECEGICTPLSVFSALGSYIEDVTRIDVDPALTDLAVVSHPLLVVPPDTRACGQRGRREAHGPGCSHCTLLGRGPGRSTRNRS